MWQVEGSDSLTTMQGFVYQMSVITEVCGPQILLSKGLRLNPSTICPSLDGDKDGP